VISCYVCSMSPEEQNVSFILDALTCPITLDLFVDPVLANDGHTYERSAIVEWVKLNETSPLTRQTITLNELKSNQFVKKLADQYRSSIQLNIGNEVGMFSGNGTLLNDEQKLNINKLFLKEKKWLLIYKATKNGFGANDFHRHCNNRGATLTLIKIRHRFQIKKHDSIVGGYTTIPWSSRNGTYRDPASFLFILSDDKLTRFNLRSPQTTAVIHNLNSGPIFGADDIHICHQANQNHSSFSKFPSSYEDTNAKGQKTLTKWKHFLVNEIEVYAVVI
jgi:hypothetical protein